MGVSALMTVAVQDKCKSSILIGTSVPRRGVDP